MSFRLPQLSQNAFTRLFWATVLAVSVAIALLGFSSRPVPVRVKSFSWANQKIGVLERYFTLTFNRSVSRQSIAENLVIAPPLPGKISWSGNRLFYTLTELPIYGTQYEVQLQDPRQMEQAFLGQFQTHDRAFVYIGVQEQERGKLILCNILTPEANLTQLKKTILTPNDITVTDFAIYPAGDKILFSAIPSVASGQTLLKQELYTVTTGLNLQNQQKTIPGGRVQRFLDANTYQNLKFALAAQGKTAVVWRVNHNNPADASIWVIPELGEARPLGIQGENFVISPNGKLLGVEQAQGVAIIPLEESAGAPQFFRDYEKILGFSADSSTALVVQKNGDGTRSLYQIRDAEAARLIWQSRNPILDCHLEPRKQQALYCLKSDLVLNKTGQLQEEPFLAIIDLNNQQDIPLLALPNYRDVQISMSPDGVALLFDQVVTTPYAPKHNLITASGQSIADGRLWLLPLPETLNAQTSQTIVPKELNAGFKPHWLP